MKNNILLAWILLILGAVQIQANPTEDGLVVQYKFDNVSGVTVYDATASGYDATLINEATVETIGKYQVLYLGNGSGYLDMGAALGDLIPTMEDFTVSVYYRVDNKSVISTTGNFLWSFADTDAVGRDAGQAFFYRLNAQMYSITPAGWANGAGDVGLNTTAAKGVWQHVLYRQTATKGQLYIDGQLVANPDSVDIPQPVTVMTSPVMAYNWLGRSPFPGDNYLRNTFIYDFRLYNRSVSDTEIAGLCSETNDLNEEYGNGFLAQLDPLLEQAEELISNHNSNRYPLSALQALEHIYTTIVTEYDNGTLSATDAPGYVEQLQLAINNYLASALGLKIHYNFNDVNGNTVTDVSGSGYNGTLFNEASVISMGKYKVLSLGNGSGYVDMGASAGNILPTANNYTVSVYHRVDKTASLTGNGYFLWAFSVLEANAASTGPYVAYRLNRQRFALTTGGYSNESGIEVGAEAVKDEWHHVLYRQTGNTGELYIDGQLIALNAEVPLAVTAFTTPSLYNWIGRAPFTNDNYLRNTLVYDFRFYNQAVEDEQITEWAALVGDLNDEYNYGTAGDFAQLIALIAECNALLSSITVGENVGEYPQAAVWELEDAILPAQTCVEENKASQFLIDTYIADLKAAYTKLLASIIAETNTLAEGEYYIKVNSLYLNNPGKSVLANGIDLSAANSGLQSSVNIVDESQIYSISKETVDEANPDLVRYSIFSTLNEADSIDDAYPYRCMTDWARYEKLALNLNWWTFDISYNQTVEAYAVYCGGAATARGYWRYIEADRRLTNQNGMTATPGYTFNFIPVYTVFVEEVARGRAAFDAAVAGTAGDEYSQSVYDAFKAALEAAEAITAGTFTNEDLFAYGAARELFVRNDGSNAFTGIEKGKPVSVSPGIIITGGDKQIRIATGIAAKIAVYTITGTAIAQKTVSSGESFIPLSPGLYIVKVAGQAPLTTKVIVR
jgi:hypothetical protein